MTAAETYVCPACENRTATVSKRDKLRRPERWDCAGCHAWGGFHVNRSLYWRERPAPEAKDG